MSKKKSGLLIAFGAMLGGAVAAGISYYLKLKSFNDELDQDTRKRRPLLRKQKKRRNLLQRELILRSIPEKTQTLRMIP